MKLHALTMPDEPAALAEWLDRQLVGPDLGRLVAELSAICIPSATATDVNTILGTNANAVMKQGLTALPREQLTKLLQQPRLLLDLQERVLVDGGSHWQKLGNTNAFDDLIAHGLDRTRTGWQLPTPVQPRRQWFAHPTVVSFATAAAVLLAVYVASPVFQPKQPGEPVQVASAIGWGWAKPGAIPAGGSPKEYLNNLAAGADEWFKKRPDDSAGVAKRLGEFRTGCTALVMSAHAPLNADDKNWLVGRCRVWGAKLDQHLQSLEAGRPAGEVRTEIDATARQIVDAINSRAEAVG